jgi:peptidoglycan hydrolase CwlO-like protein
MLKGAQMQNGKLQKKVEQLSAEILAKDIQAQELRDAIAARETSIKSLQEQLDEALTTRVPLHEQEPQTKITAHDEVDSEESS